MSENLDTSPYNLQPFRRAVFRGLALVLPPLLTFVILLWIGNSVQTFVLNPVEWASRQTMVWYINDTLTSMPEGATPLPLPTEGEPEVEAERPPETTPSVDDNEAPTDLQRLAEAVERLERRFDAASGSLGTASEPKEAEDKGFTFEGRDYVQLANGEFIPVRVRNAVNAHIRASGEPLANSSGRGYYNHYVEHSVLKSTFIIPVFLAGFILAMYLLGKFLAAGVGRYLWNFMEGIINQLPIIRTVYSSVKQVTDFFVGENDIDFQRVVAVEYPRKGIWSIGFVTGESLMTIRGAVDEPVLSVLMPTSPVPGTGFTVTVRKSETIDLAMPIDQALQFVVSCGVVIPEEEIQQHVSSEPDAQRRLADRLALEN